MKRVITLASRVRKLFKSFGYAFEGVYASLASEQNLLIHFIAAIAVIIAGFIVQLNGLEWILITLCITLVIGAELFNTAIELLTDMISPQMSPMAKKVKDISAAAVLIISIGALVTGAIIFVNKLA